MAETYGRGGEGLGKAGRGGKGNKEAVGHQTSPIFTFKKLYMLCKYKAKEHEFPRIN